MKRFLFLLVLPLLLLVWGLSAAYTVDYAEFAYVTRFGEPVTTKDGGTDAGLHWKLPWPIESVIRVDRRLQTLERACCLLYFISPVRAPSALP